MLNRLQTSITQMQGKSIMIIGDMVADIYLEGQISRVSREAPVLVLENTGETVVPGGAANVVHNAATLGGTVYAVGVIGDDAAGREVAGILGAKGVITAGLIVDQVRPTIAKTRVMAGGQATVRQQVVRIDKELKLALSTAIEGKLLEYIADHIAETAAVVMSDYGSNTISPMVRCKVIELCRLNNIPCIVDSRYRILDFVGVSLVKQNEAEAASALGYDSIEQIGAVEAARVILNRMDAQGVLITQGPGGMTLVMRSGEVVTVPVTDRSEVFDVSGAGDTVVATMMLAVAGGANYSDAVRLANIAAGVVVRKPGTATISAEELLQAAEFWNECK